MKKQVIVKNVKIGANSKIAIQTMTNTKTTNVKATLAQIESVEKAGADLVRVSVPDEASANAINEIVKETNMPIIGDFHFGTNLALKAVENGIHKVRINPGNVGDQADLRQLALLCNARNVPIRIGVNGGSLHSSYENLPLADALANSAYDYQKKFEDYGFENLVLSVKSSDVKTMIDAYRKLDKLSDCPLHVGVTEAGTYENGIIKSSIGIGSLLLDGIGDTIRVSLTTSNLQDEVRVGKKILRSIGLQEDMVDVVCCPTCARTQIDVENLAKMVEDETSSLKLPIKIAVMGCVVNGIGEGKDADLGIAGGKEQSVIIAKGKILQRVNNEDLLSTFKNYLDRFCKGEKF